MVQDTRCVDDLPASIIIVQMADKEGFGGEGIGLNIDICSGDFVHEAGFADVGVAAADESSGRRVDSRQTAHVLSDLFEVGQRVLLTFDDGGHASESSFLELLASIERVAKLEQSGIVFAHRVNEVSGGVDLAESQFVMIFVVKNVEQ